VDDRLRADPPHDEDRDLMPWLYGLLAVLFVGLGLVAIPMLRDEGPVERLGGSFAGGRDTHERHSVVMQLVNNLAGRLGPRLAPTMRASRRSALEHRIDYAGRPGGLTVTRFIGLQASLAVLLGLVVGGFLVLLGSSVMFLILLAAIGWFGPAVWLSRAGRLRQEAIEKALPDFLDILAVSVRAGLGYRLALRRVAEALQGAVAEEMLTVLRQMELGSDRREAFLALRERNKSESLKSFVAAQLQAEELGVPLAEALNDIAGDMRRLAYQNARRDAQRAAPRVSLLVTTLIVPGAMILILLSVYYATNGAGGNPFG
jgi:Flp pilus assembly protein TadB